MKRKLGAILIAVVLLLQAWPIIASAARDDVICLTAARQALQPGEMLTVAVEGQRLSNLYGAEIRLAYDSGKLKFKSAERRVSGGAIYDVKPIVTDGGMMLAFTRTGRNTPGLTGDALLYDLIFEAVAAGLAEISVTSATLVDDHAASRSADLGESVSVEIRHASPSDEPTPSPSPAPAPAPPRTSALVSTPSDSPGVFLVEAEAELTDDGIMAVAELDEALNNTGAEIIRVVVGAPPDTVKVQIRLHIGQILAALNNKVQAIEIDTGSARVSMNAEYLNLLSGSSTDDLLLVVEKVDVGSLPAAVQERLSGQSAIYDFSLSIGSQPAESLGNRNITILLPYSLKAGENPHKVVVYRLAGSNSVPETVKTSKYDPETGMAAFKPEHFSRYAAVYADITFRDMADAAWAVDSVEALAVRDIIHGVGDNRFDPGAQITRAQFVTMLMQAFDLDNRESVSPFRDVEDGQWYSRAIATAGKLGIVQGREDGTFGINEGISRQDMAVLLYRMAKLLGVDGFSLTEGVPSFSDREEIGDYAAEAVAAMQTAGIMDGLEFNRFLPLMPSTRAQAAAVVFRFYLRQ